MDPVVLFFLLGLVAKLAKSDLRLPEALYETLSIFLLLAIGLKGGVEFAKVPEWRVTRNSGMPAVFGSCSRSIRTGALSERIKRLIHLGAGKPALGMRLTVK